MQRPEPGLFEQLIKALCEPLGLTVPPVLDGAFHFSADDIEIDLLSDAGGESLIIQCRLATLDSEPGLDLLAELCEANFRWCATGGGTLSLHTGAGEIHLAREYPLQGLDHNTFMKLLERFIDAADFWKRRLGGRAARPDAQPPAEGSASDYFVRI